jgi:ABC-type polysaccharide/polyol phosphate transport system ATPase subunit
MLGRPAGEMRERCHSIIEWAGLDEYADSPVRVLSSGMMARLAFSVAADLEPHVLLIDEILSVGDEAFQRKSSRRISALIDRGTAVVLVSHNMEQISQRCHRVLWLDSGRIREMGRPTEIVAHYAKARE